MHQITLFQDKKSKNFLGRGLCPLPKPLSPRPTLSAPRAPQWSRLRRSLLDASFKAEGRLVFQTFIRPFDSRHEIR